MSREWSLRYEGTNSKGRSVGGSQMVTDVGEFIRDRFDAGWRTLTVRHGAAIVGGIGPHPDDHKRTWWTE